MIRSTCQLVLLLMFLCVFLAQAQSTSPGTPQGVPFRITDLASGIEAFLAGEGRTLINQEKALAGDVTPLDAPGFPVRISKGGSYMLTSDLVVPDAYTTGILIATADPVSINLNGFAIRGSNDCGTLIPGGCTQFGTGHGITMGLPRSISIRIYGGSVTGMGYGCINLFDPGHTVENVQASNCRFGISSSGTIRNNLVRDIGGVGIYSYDAIVQGNFVTRCGGDGIYLIQGLAVDNQSAWNNGLGFRSLESSSLTPTLPTNAGFRGNSLSVNNNGGIQASGGTQLGPNLCNGALCP